MSKYKVLKSVAHNLGHSFLSDMNTVDSFGTFVPEIIFQLAQAHHLPRIAIDFLSGSIEPPQFAVADVRKSLEMYRGALPGLVESQGASWDVVRGAKLEIVFDLSMTKETMYAPHRPVPTFSSTVEIMDDRGIRHLGHPQHWWIN
jgi:hypothetical protein